MDEEEIQASCVSVSEDSLYPMYFGVSCAFFALELLSRSNMNDVDHQFSETRDRMLQGSAHLLGLLVWKIQKGEAMERRSELLRKLEKAEIEVAELKKRRSEDAKANEKVVGIFASQEQSWLTERKKLRQQIGALLNELRVLGTKKEETISDLNKKIQEKELFVESRIKALEEEEEGKRKELELKLEKVEDVVKELRETANKEAKEHNSQLWKHKTALIELVSNQRQLEAEMGRALRQLEASKQDLDSVLKQKEESVSMVQNLSMEIVKMRKDSEQKDKILSAMLRKSKIDSAEKEIVLKELKISKSRRKQAELETERWRTLYGSRHERDSSRTNLAYQTDSRLEVFSWVKEVHTIEATSSQNRRIRSHPTNNRVHPKTEAEHRTERGWIESKRMGDEISNSRDWDQHSLEGDGELGIMTDVKELESWVRSETEKNTSMLEQRHHVEIDAFAEQLRLKDEKLEAFNWRLLSMELESKRLQSHIEGLDQNLSQLREENMKLETLLMDRESEVKSLKDKVISLQLHHPHYRKINSNSSPKALTSNHENIWSKVKIIKKKPREIEEEKMATLIRISEVVDSEKEEKNPLENQSKDTILTVIQSPEEEIEAPEEDIEEVEKEVTMDTGHVAKQCPSPMEVKVVDKLASVNHSLLEKDSHPWKMDLHALGVSYKIKRLKQQLIMLEKLAGFQTSNEKRENYDNEPQRLKKFLLLIMPLLNKQVSRYQTLEENTNNLCKRMYDNNINLSGGDSSIVRTKEEMKKLENFLEETFQLQRYMVATGQKLMEIQSRIASELVSGAEDAEQFAGFDMKRFANSTTTLFRDVQRGLEVRISRIIGDLEGTLAYEGIIHLRN
ncbi:hypothetical protein BVC80_1101g36 [Macleaya cordata]|uniref:Uncharacterized protein n=1 Tax=Macleaya cordata TaxID=56857 RepID=A0A200QCT3_MACCD|nr:hypothetical protein BVC80_1101g36 [Macleaya cordata]